MEQNDCTVFDTDMFLHDLSTDRMVRDAAKKEFNESRPSAMCSFSLLEFKGNFIQCLILLQRKITDSDSLEEAYSRISVCGERRAKIMLAQLINWLGGVDFPINPWDSAKAILLTHIDAQIEVSWESIQQKVDKIIDLIDCDRASEAPETTGSNWAARIPKCRKDNTQCKVASFLSSFRIEFDAFKAYFNSLPDERKTTELTKIYYIISNVLKKGRFEWEKNLCRGIGDLLIGLQSKTGKELLSSNYKEHSILHEPLNYNFRKFPLADLRMK